MVHPITVAVGLGLGIGAILFTLFYGNRFQEETPHQNRPNTSQSRRSNYYVPPSE